MEDAQLLSLVALADEVLACSAALSKALQRGRLELASAALFGGAGGGAAGLAELRLFAYLPPSIAPSLRLAPGGELGAGLLRLPLEHVRAGSAAGAPADGAPAAGTAPAGLRRRRPAGDASGDVQNWQAEEAGETGENADAIVQPVDPLAWCGPGAPAGLRAAAAAFADAVAAADRLAHARAELAAAMPHQPFSA